MDHEVTVTRSAAAYLLSAESLRAAESYSSAIEQYQKALADEQHLSPDDRISLRVHLADCLTAKSRFRESRDVLSPLLESSESLDLLSQARVLSRMGWTDFFLGNLDSCCDLCGKAASLLLPTSHHGELANSLRWLGYAHLRRGDLEEASDRFSEALAAARRGSDSAQQASCLESLGNLSLLEGRLDKAVLFHERSLSLHQSRGSLDSVGRELLHIGIARFYLGELEQAEAHLIESEQVLGEIGRDRGRILVWLARGRVSQRKDDLDRAREHAGKALKLARKISYKRAIVLAKEEFGDLAVEADDLEKARYFYEEALDEGRAIAPRGDLVYEIAWRLARVFLAQGRREEAESLADEAIRLAESSSDRRELGHGLATLALVRAAEGDIEEARSLLDRSLDEFRRIQTPYELAQSHELTAAVLREAESRGTAEVLGHLFEARRLYGKLGAGKASDRVDREIRELEARSARNAGGPAAGGRAVDSPDPVEEAETPTRLVTASERILDLVATAKELTGVESPVLIEGETGTGKELIARIIHEAGPQRDRPFVAVNCAAFPEPLLESELFGHRRGAFTGASQDRQGILESAQDGSVLLDEIDKASVDFQTKLLRVIEERKFRPVGASELMPLRARVLCASNRDLRALAEKGTFLPDLFYRLAGIRLRIPALRDRPEDIPVLVRHFLGPCASRFGVSTFEISPEAEAALVSYGWPGNVRELKNVIEGGAFFARKTGVLDLAHLPPEVRHPARGSKGTLAGRIEQVERREILAALERSRGVKTEAARILGVSRKGLRDRLRRLGLE